MSKTTTVSKHFVTFLSPGTFVSEETQKPISSWDVKKAMKMAGVVVERYGATPYAFYFTTRSRAAGDLDSKESERSHLYHLGGKIETLTEVEARNRPDESILRSNMRANGYDKIVVNTNSYKSVHPLENGDVVLDWTPPKRKKT